MSTTIPGGIARMQPPGRAPAGRTASPPDGFDAAFRGAGGPSSTSADADRATREAEDGREADARSAHWAHRLPADDTPARAGREAADGQADADAGGRLDEKDAKAGRPLGKHVRADGDGTSADAEDGGDAAGDGSEPAERKKDRTASLAIPVTVQPQTAPAPASRGEAEPLGSRKAAAKDTPAGAASATPAAEGKPRKPAAEAAERQPAEAKPAARILTQGASAPSALAGFNARLAAADADRRLSNGGDAPRADETPLPHASARAQERSHSERVRQLSALEADGSSDGGKNRGKEEPAPAHGFRPQFPSAAANPQGPVGPAAAGSHPGANIAAVADGIAARPDWTQALSAGATGATGPGGAASGVKAMVVQLNPAHLGAVTVTLTVAGDRLAINLQVQTAEAYRQLSTGNDAILDKLKGHGYAVEAITVQHLVVDRAEGPQPRPFQHAFAGSQGNPGGSAQGGQHMAGQGQGHRSGGQSVPAEERVAGGGDAPGPADPSGARADGVYI